jgi:bacterioferritin-associated ferredoxin
MIICVCKAVGERAVREAILAGARTVAELARATGASTDCGTCAEHLVELLAEERTSSPTAPAHPAGRPDPSPKEDR